MDLPDALLDQLDDYMNGRVKEEDEDEACDSQLTEYDDDHWPANLLLNASDVHHHLVILQNPMSSGTLSQRKCCTTWTMNGSRLLTKP